MLIYFLKGSFDYCLANKKFFTFIVLLVVLYQTIFDICVGHNPDAQFEKLFLFVLLATTSLLVIGYGLNITKDLINGGKRLPKLRLNMLSFGIKATPVIAFYMVIQAILLNFVSLYFLGPEFDFEEILLHFGDTLMVILKNDLNTFTFYAIGFIVFYITTFFLEIALAQLADSGKILKAFNFKLIIQNINKIGWLTYTKEYTYVAISVVILTLIGDFLDPYPFLDLIASYIIPLLIFVIEFGSIGIIFRKTKKC